MQLGLIEARPAGRHKDGHIESDMDEGPVLATRRTDLRGRTPRQREYIRNILEHDITFGIGPAGTGKTYLAVACAADALERERQYAKAQAVVSTANADLAQMAQYEMSQVGGIKVITPSSLGEYSITDIGV